MKQTAIVLLFLAASALSARGKLGDTAYESVRDNLEDCRPNVRAGIERLRESLGEIHFTCTDGRLQKLLAPRDAPIFAQSPEAFAQSNIALFLDTRSTKVIAFEHMHQFDSKFQSTAYQTYGGFKIWGGVAFRRNPVEFDPKFQHGRYGMFHVDLVDTSTWRFHPRERLKCPEALERARAFDAKNAPSHDQFSCEAWPQIVERFCGGGPALVQRIAAFNRSSGATEEELLMVDAGTGRVCR